MKCRYFDRMMGMETDTEKYLALERIRASMQRHGGFVCCTHFSFHRKDHLYRFFRIMNIVADRWHTL